MTMTYLILAVAVALAYQIFRIGRDVYRSYQCVDESTLRSFQYGRLDENGSTYRHVVNHLSQCEECQETLREIQRGKGKRLEDHLVEQKNR